MKNYEEMSPELIMKKLRINLNHREIIGLKLFIIAFVLYEAFHFVSIIEEQGEVQAIVSSLNSFCTNFFWLGLLFVSLRFIKKKNFKRLRSSFVLFGLISITIRIYIANLLELNLELAVLLFVFLGVTFDLLLLYLCFIFSLKLRWGRVLYLLSCLGLLFFQVFDLCYFYSSYSHIDVILLRNINATSLEAFLEASVGVYFCVFVGVVLFVFLLVFLIKNDFQSLQNSLKNLKILCGLTGALYIICMSYGLLVNFIFLDEHTEIKGKEFGREKNRWLVSEQSLVCTLTSILKLYKVRDVRAYQKMSVSEISDLKSLGVLGSTAIKSKTRRQYKRIIIVMFESLSIDYFHYYNKNIPKEASKYFDFLLNSYPRIDNFFTANQPTRQGVNALLRSQIEHRYEFDMAVRPGSIYGLLKEKGYVNYFVRGVTKLYRSDNVVYKKLFDIEHFIGSGDLDPRYGTDSGNKGGWGYHNDIVYDEGLRILKEQRDSKILITLKTIDFHDPKYNGFNNNELPASLRHSSKVLKSLYWIDRQLKKFIENLKKAELFDDDTLVIITADHSPVPARAYKEYSIKSNFGPASRIPLIFLTKEKDIWHDLNSKIYASQIDFAPTIASLFGIDYPDYFQGQSLFEKGKKFALSFHKDIFYYRSKENNHVIDMTQEHIGQKGALKKWLENSRNLAEDKLIEK